MSYIRRRKAMPIPVELADFKGDVSDIISTDPALDWIIPGGSLM